MKRSVLLVALITIVAHFANADVPPASATSAAQSVATKPKNQTPAGNALQDEINQQKIDIQQKNNWRNLENSMKQQEKNMNSQIAKEAKNNGKHRKQPSGPQPKKD
jgi:hypothetical protein